MDTSSTSSEEDEEMLVAAMMSFQVVKNQRRFWVHDINRKRPSFGEFTTCFKICWGTTPNFSSTCQYSGKSPEKFFELKNLISNDIEKQHTTFRRPVSTTERLAVCLRFLATGDTFRTVAFSYRLGKTTVRRIVYECCKAIWKNLQPQHMPVPDKAMWERIANEYETRWNFSNCIGALDGKHVVFEKPAKTGSLYFNYKKTFSIVLLALFDANYKFGYVDVGAMGKNSDGGIFSNSTFGKKLQTNQLDLPPDTPLPGTITPVPYVIVADEAFPLLPNLLRPFPGDSVVGDRNKKIFNYRLSRARNTSEDGFGILTKKFRMYRRVMQITPEHLTTCVLATCVLHNYLREDFPHFENDLPDEPSECLQNVRAIGGRSSQKAVEVRCKFKHYFNSNVGSVSWQDKAICVGKLQQE